MKQKRNTGFLKAEAKYKEFVNADVEKTKVDKEAADAVCNKIAAIGTVEYTNKSKALIEEARAAYDSLTEKEKHSPNQRAVLF